MSTGIIEPHTWEESFPRQIPTGECWCGCGVETSLGAFFAPGHDKTAESRVIADCYGTVANFLWAHAYHPSGSNWPGERSP
jgi:hypothetical protein